VTDAGHSIGFEDMCCLQALGTQQKYNSSYEKVAKSIRDFVSPEFRQQARDQFFATLVLSNIVRNGDAHLKNFGVLYDQPGATVRLSPVYDVVTTTAYISKDVPALTLAGTKKWWSVKMLEQFAVVHLSLTIGKAGQIVDEVATAVTDTRAMLSAYTKDHPDFSMVGDKMLAAWESGLASVCSVSK